MSNPTRMEALSMGHVYKLLKQVEIPDAPAYFSNRLVLEQCENIHLHYRNLRLEFTAEEFVQLYQAVKEGLRPMQEYVLGQAEQKILPLTDILPYDPCHKDNGQGHFDCGPEQKAHEDGIHAISEAIKAGKKIQPIAVYYDKEKHKFQRCDGFKRFWAYKVLGLKEIPCFVLNRYIPGIQHEMPGII